MLAAGGTGGHLFPAEALAHELTARGWQVHLATDDRAERFAGKFPAAAIHPISSSTIGSKNPIALLRAFWSIWRGVRQASKVIAQIKPSVVIGFGGYPTLPPLYAATRRSVPSMVHEQNAVMGRANKALAARVDAVAGGFLPENAGANSAKVVVTGNPVRPAVIEAAKTPYIASTGADAFNLLVFGGSQGAARLNAVVPAALATIDSASRPTVIHQAGERHLAQAQELYAKHGVQADVRAFIDDMAQTYAWADLVVCRSGALTVSELAAAGLPAIFVPFAAAVDDHQTLNAKFLVDTQAAVSIVEAQLTPQRLAEELQKLLSGGRAKLAEMATRARSVAIVDADVRLADACDAVAGGAR